MSKAVSKRFSAGVLKNAVKQYISSAKDVTKFLKTLFTLAFATRGCLIQLTLINLS